MQLRLLSLFSGIGAFEKALGDKVELVNYCEIDKYAAKAYSLIHNVPEDLNLKDVTKVDTSKLHNIDMVTYAFPCQDISCAGKCQGFVDSNGNRTRSGLFFEALRIIKDTQPKYAIAENVKNLVSKKFRTEFETVISELDKAGYVSYYDVLNAKDYGIPQNRERVFIVSIRKDIDNGTFEFPESIPLDKRLKDVLETEVDERFYLKDTMPFFIKNSLAMEEKGNGFRFSPHVKDHANIAKTITTRAGGRMDDNFIMEAPSLDCDTFTFNKENVAKVMQVGNLRQGNGWDNPQCGRVYDTQGLSPTLNTMQGGDRQPKIVERVTAAAMRGRGPENTQQIELSDRDYSNALTTVQKDSLVAESSPFRIRKLTPLECWRLMGFDDDDFYKARNAGISNSQLYKQAGNSIVVNVLQAIFRQFNFEVAEK